jgi:tetratricopeptide (TPR) repeat protein
MNRNIAASIVLSICFFLFGALLSAASNDKLVEELFEDAQLLYESKDYEAALPIFKKIIEIAPMESKYHHMLGKCYGRIAEEGSWLTALGNVRKTLKQFKKAVELDAGNIQALRDLEEFYRRAPGFLGGDIDKADEIKRRLAEISATKNTDFSGISVYPEP